jgi:hypothetical protein
MIQIHKIESVAGLNAQVIWAGPCRLIGAYVQNSGNEMNYLKLFNKATEPTPGTDHPNLTLGAGGTFASTTIPANVFIPYPGAWFSAGLSMAITGGISDSDSTSISAKDTLVHVFYEVGAV